MTGLAGRPVCLHASFRSFGPVEGGPDSLIDAFLEEGCTLLLLCLSYQFAALYPKQHRYPRNGIEYGMPPRADLQPGAIFDPKSNEVEVKMVGVLPRFLLQRRDRIRGNHPRSSFAALGPMATDLVGGQRPLKVFEPLHALVRAHGFVVMMGVEIDKMTLLHVAEQNAGRESFRRWANGLEDSPIEVQEGGCSAGFVNLTSGLANLASNHVVGNSRWQIFPAAETLTRATELIRATPAITHCPDDGCLECRDAILGGPIIG